MHDGLNSVGYARVSTDEQISENQIIKLKEFGVPIIFSDEGVSGKRLALERPEYREMMRYLEKNPLVKTIVVYELSRLGRNMLDSITTFLKLEEQGYFIYSLTESWTHQTDPSMREFMILIVSWMNAQELKRLSGRTKAGLDRARAQGKVLGRPFKELDKDTVLSLKASGKSWKEIAVIFRVDDSTLFRYRQRWKAKELGRT
jgi:DNA invertase Pin-like site-specific DNA recombinase